MKNRLILLIVFSRILVVSASEAAADKPNLLLIVLDDAGYSDLGCYGGEIETPNIDGLAAGGIRFSQFHVTPNCSTTRASLLTGMDHHRTGLGTHEGMADNQKGQPGYEGYLNQRVVTLPEALRPAGYRTLMAGKWHLGGKAPSMWPSARGFDDSFALLNGMAAHWKAQTPILPSYLPTFVDNGHQVKELPNDFYSTDFFTNRIMRSIDSDTGPFFAYLAFTAPHNPLHAPGDLIQKYAQRYQQGWDVLHRQRLARLTTQGLVPEHVPIQPRPDWIPAWDSLSEAAQQTSARDMAIYAAMIDRIDQSIGRVVARLKETGQYDNTCIVVMSDNGANKSTMADYLVMAGDAPDYLQTFNNTFNNRGLPESSVDHGPGWAYGLAAPFRLMKGYQSQGGVLAPLIIKPPADLNPGLHRMLVKDAKDQYAELFRRIIHSEQPIVFHCSHGIHRTGTAAAILLWSAGVPWETVRADYLLSNHYRRAEIQHRTEQLRQLAAKTKGVSPDDIDMTNINAFYVLEGHYIDGARDQIMEDYGSVNTYLTKGLGLSGEEVRQLHQRLCD